MALFNSALLSVLAIFSCAALTTADSNPSPVSITCQSLQKVYPDQVLYGYTFNSTSNDDYREATQDYWSKANADPVNQPQCVFLPEAAPDVAFAIQVLNQNPSVRWAVKGAGHNPNVGFSSAGGGVLIALEKMNSTFLDDQNRAHIGAGSRWGPAQSVLDSYGRAVVGGRLGPIGVAGLTLGGGLSFLSAEHGFAADSVVSYEIVTAAGEVTQANSASNPDIFYALKGGGSQFAIVTTFIMQTYPIGRVWGGHKFYTLDKKAQLLQATHNLASDYHDPKAAVIVTFSTTVLNLVQVFVVFYFYNDASGPGPILDEYNAIEALSDNTKAGWLYGDLLKDNGQFSLEGMRYLIRENTIPSLPGSVGMDLFNYTFNSWHDASQLRVLGAVDNLIFNMAFQPVPHQMIEASVNSPYGGNRLGMLPETGDHCFMEYDLSWLLPSTDALAAQYLQEVTQPVADYQRAKYSNTAPSNYKSGNLSFTNFNPVFMNDAMYDQDPLRSYGEETYQRLAQIQKQVDSQGLFSKRTKGFKFE